MRFYLLLFCFYEIIDFLNGYPAPNSKIESDPGVLPNIDGMYCNNIDIRKVVFNVLSNITDPDNVAVDQIQATIEAALMPKFQASGGTWLVSATSYHRVKGYVDDQATTMQTFCVVNDPNLNLYLVIMKIDNT